MVFLVLEIDKEDFREDGIFELVIIEIEMVSFYIIKEWEERFEDE